MFSEHIIRAASLKGAVPMQAGNGTAWCREVPVEYWLNDDRFREANGAALVRQAIDQTFMLEGLDEIYPGLAYDIRVRLRMLSKKEHLEREIRFLTNRADTDAGLLELDRKCLADAGAEKFWDGYADSARRYEAKLAESNRQLDQLREELKTA